MGVEYLSGVCQIRAAARAIEGRCGGRAWGYWRGACAVPPRGVLQRLLPKPGEGPSARSREAGWFLCELLGVAADGRRVHGLMRHRGDPSNQATVCFVCELALCLALHEPDLPGGLGRGGVLTPATALGDVLAKRLRQSGMPIGIAL